MSHFNQRPGTKSAVHMLKNPIPDIAAFNDIVQTLIMTNPLGCTSYYYRRKNHKPIERIRERYTAKFLYMGPDGERVGAGQETYNSVEGYQYGVAAVLSHMANFAAHAGKARHIPEQDLFSVILNCHDPGGEVYFLALARDRVTLASYEDNAIRETVEVWSDSVPELE